MIEPSINTLTKKFDRFTLCSIAGKRARQLVDGEHKLSNCISNNAITVAVNEINESRIVCRRRK